MFGVAAEEVRDRFFLASGAVLGCAVGYEVAPAPRQLFALLWRRLAMSFVVVIGRGIRQATAPYEARDGGLVLRPVVDYVRLDELPDEVGGDEHHRDSNHKHDVASFSRNPFTVWSNRLAAKTEEDPLETVPCSLSSRRCRARTEVERALDQIE